MYINVLILFFFFFVFFCFFSESNSSTSPSKSNTLNETCNTTMVSFSEAEITSLRLLFQFMDRDCRGYLTKEMIIANGEDNGDYIDTFELVR